MVWYGCGGDEVKMPPLATLAGVRAFEADGTYQPPAIESGRGMMMAGTATVTATALIPIRTAQTL